MSTYWELWCLFCGAILAGFIAYWVAIVALSMLSFILYEFLTIDWQVAITRPLLMVQFSWWCLVQACTYAFWEGWPTEITDGDWVWSYPCFIRRRPAD